jgi:ABC-type uncharacterized transport system permease subunit
MEWIHNKFLLTLGGTLIPLDLFPSWLATLSRALPFASVMYARRVPSLPSAGTPSP